MKGVNRCAKILAYAVFLGVESHAFSNALKTTLTANMEHHLEAYDVRILLNDTFLLIEAIEGFVSLWIEISRVEVPISSRCS